jgi:surfactin synthase thioesterase subunit
MVLQENSLFVVPQRLSVPKLRLFCFPFAGGSAQSYQQWQNYFNQDIELVFVQLKGRGSRINEQPHQNMQELVDELMLHSAYLTEYPYIIFGHSMGALIGYALCCQLKKRSLSLPLRFIASACRAPHQPYLAKVRHSLPHNEFILALEQLNGTPAEVLRNKELMELFEPMLRADFRIAETYRAPQVQMPFAFTVLFGDKDSSLALHQLQAWQELTEKNADLFAFPGEHFFIQQCTKQVLSCIQSVISQLALR